jgi:zinc transport system substrate-binding protein
MGSRTFRRFFAAFSLSLAAAAGLASGSGATLVACKSGSGGDRAPSDKPRVAVSIFPLYDVARRVAGDRLDVVLVLPAGRSEHSYDPTPREMALIAKARLAVSVGLGMDGWLEKIVQGAAGKDVPVVQLGPGASPRKMTAQEVGVEAAEEAAEEKEHKEHDERDDDHAKKEGGAAKKDDHDHAKKEGAAAKKDDDHDHDPKGPTREYDKEDEKKEEKPKDDHAHHAHAPGAEDPHFWLDPVRMMGATDALVEAFAKLDPAGAEDFRRRGGDVKKSLGELHAAIDAKSKGWTKKTIVTFHGSMGYFADRYGLKIAAVVEPFPGKEPTPRYIKDVLGAIQKSQAAALFSEPQLDKKPAQVIADQAKLPLFELDPVGGSAGADTYEKLLTKNADTLDKALK